jgi:hypothetical protein
MFAHGLGSLLNDDSPSNSILGSFGWQSGGDRLLPGDRPGPDKGVKFKKIDRFKRVKA